MIKISEKIPEPSEQKFLIPDSKIENRSNFVEEYILYHYIELQKASKIIKKSVL